DADVPRRRGRSAHAPGARRGIRAAAHHTIGAARVLPSAAPQDAFERVRLLPFVERRRDGLIVHDAVKRVIASALRTSDPSRHRADRRAAWQHFRTELRTAGGPDLWRTTADVLYLIENPVIRGAFFPEEAQRYSVEPARADDGAAIHAIARRHDGPRAAAGLN